MTDERIRRAAEEMRLRADHLATHYPDTDEAHTFADAAHILELLAEGKAVLCEAEPGAVVLSPGEATPRQVHPAPDKSLHFLFDPWKA